MSEEAKNIKPIKSFKTARQEDLLQPKIPPQALDVEKAVLGAMLIDKRGVNEAIDILFPEVFYLPEHQLIYQAIFSLFQDLQPIDFLTVSQRLEKMGKLKEAGGEFYLVELAKNVASAANIEFHARILLEKYIRREMIDIARKMEVNAFDETRDIFEILDEAEQQLFSITQGSLKQAAQSVDKILMDVKNQLEEIGKGDKLPGIRSGFPSIDEITAGWQRGDLIILAARPSMGKTAFALNMARNISIDYKIPVAFFSLEMTAQQLVKRILSAETQIPAEKFRTGNFTDEELKILNHKISVISNNPNLYINDSSMMTIFDLRAQARRMKSKYGIEIIFIDYLQLMHASDKMKPGNREQEISTISRNLKALAKELDIPIIALSQLSRKVEERNARDQHKRPMLSDLRESGAIEQDADIVSFIYRPEYYGLMEWDDDDEASPTHNEAEFIIAKHRNGKTARIRLKFYNEIGLFAELDHHLPLTKEEKSVFESKINRMPDIDPKDAFGKESEDDFPF